MKTSKKTQSPFLCRKHLTEKINSEQKLFPELDPWLPFWPKKNNFFFKPFEGSFFMRSEDGPNERIPAGYTYFGQFLAHELSFHIAATKKGGHKAQKKNNLSTPLFDLDTLYGDGPSRNPFFYDQRKNNGRTHFFLEEVKVGKEKVYDFARINQGPGQDVPLIPDGRNDENILINQIHIALQLFHNEMVNEEEKNDKDINHLKNRISQLMATPSSLVETKKSTLLEFARVQRHEESYFSNAFYKQAELPDNKEIYSKLSLVETQRKLDHLYDKFFQKAKQKTQWHFQWIIIHDFLPKIVGRERVENTIKKKLGSSWKNDQRLDLQFFLWKEKAFIPLEFFAAIFRFGHSMVATGYRFTENHQSPRSLFEIKLPHKKLNEIYVNWSLFFHDPNPDLENNNSKLNNSNVIDPLITLPMTNKLPVSYSSKSIVFRNLSRSFQMKLPSGQSVARAMGEEPYSAQAFRTKVPTIYDVLEETFPNLSNEQDATKNFAAFCDDTPLWFYILMEASIAHKGKKLGPVGSCIVVEVIIGILEADPNSLFHQTEWEPDFLKAPKQDKDHGDHSMMQLLKYIRIDQGAFVKEENSPPIS